ncbi:hypothetical protein Hypma_001931 [Hypsizygus marmoreus]|uniref:F-box domain-containing protein n=1 Tax=Hypsizygus marmoreus TaxID=39966 RepID=A0A369JC46_HYPMA|nr:hypothetical protein Hypma_001931 [Hypsizygus marmoreus]
MPTTPSDDPILEGKSDPTSSKPSVVVEPRPKASFRCVHKGVLDNQDILGRVFEYFSSEPCTFPKPLTNTHLLWAALTCKAFLEPALNVLWRSASSLVPLLNLLPTFQLVQDTYVIRGVTREPDWNRYFYYARRVREFYYPGELGEDKKIANHTKVRLAQLWTTPLLPALRRFICLDVSAPGLFIHPLFLSHTIEHVELRFISDGEDEAVGTLLATISDEVPSLRSLILWGFMSIRTLSYVPELKNLQLLHLRHMGPAIDSQFIASIGAFEYLTDLAIDFNGSPYSRFPVDPGFTTLKQLSITATFNIAQDFLTSLSKDVVLNSLSFVVPPGPFTMGWEDQLASLFSKICERWPSSLQSITLDHEGTWDHVSLSMSNFVPLVQLPHIKSLQVIQYLTTLSNDDIHQLASAWPNLETLSFPFDHGIAPNTKPTFSALYTLAALCPHIKSIQIPLTFQVIPPLPDPRPASRRLESLFIGCVDAPHTIPDLLIIAHHIDRLFPRLKLLANADGDIDVWERVWCMIQAFRSVRSEEFNRD